MKPTAMPARRPVIARPQGAAALVVVMVLFFIMALAAAYASRNLVFEQRISTNNVRATQAQEAAEAGIEWAVGLLSQGRVDEACLPTADAGSNTFRDRHLTQTADGWFSVAAGQQALRPGCLMGNGGWQCGCPAAGLPALGTPGLPTPTFQVRFVTDASIDRPGLIRIESRGCSSAGMPCYAGAGVRAEADAWSTVLLGISPQLANPPQAPLVARGRLDLRGRPVNVINTDVASSGLTIIAGDTIDNASNLQASSTPGTPAAATVLAGDPALAALDAAHMFVSVFGVDATTYRLQPAVVRVPCSSGCAGALAAAAAAQPGRALWVLGDLNVDTPLDLGTPTTPVMLVVDGKVNVNATMQLNGMLYVRDNEIDASAPMSLRGAVVAEGDLRINGQPRLAYDAPILRRLQLNQGSLVRVPGSWRDFATN